MPAACTQPQITCSARFAVEPAPCANMIDMTMPLNASFDGALMLKSLHQVPMLRGAAR